MPRRPDSNEHDRTDQPRQAGIATEKEEPNPIVDADKNLEETGVRNSPPPAPGNPRGLPGDTLPEGAGLPGNHPDRQASNHPDNIVADPNPRQAMNQTPVGSPPNEQPVHDTAADPAQYPARITPVPQPGQETNPGQPDPVVPDAEPPEGVPT